MGGQEMRFRGMVRCALSVWICVGSFQVLAVADPHLKFSKLPAFAGIRLSPDGQRAVALRAINDTYHVALIDFATGSSKLLMAADPEEFLFHWCRFANNTRVVCRFGKYIVQQTGLPGRFYRDGRNVATRLYAVDVDGSNQLQLVRQKRTRLGGPLQFNSPNQSRVVHWLPEDPDHILIALNRDDRLYPAVYRLNIRTNRTRLVQRHKAGILGWSADANGVIRNGWGLRPGEKGHVVSVAADGSTTELKIEHLAGVQAPSIEGYLSNGNAIVVANNGRNTLGLLEVNPTTAKVVREIYHDASYDTWGNMLRLPQSGEILAVLSTRAPGEYIWFDQALKTEYEVVKASLPGKPSHVLIRSTDAKANRLILHSSGNGTHPSVWMYDRVAKSLMALGKDYADVPADELSEKQLVEYAARDGLKIPAYLSLPPGRPAKDLPTVILPHGGPYLRELGYFDYWANYLTSRGIAVLQPNFRGSAGFGDKFMRAGFHQWGEKMQQDLDDGLAWMIEQGYTDAERVCMVGGSYGGYAALVAAYKSTDKYRCAVSFAGVSDLDGLVERWRLFKTGRLALARVQRGKARDANSPVKHVSAIDIPLLLVHGDVDVSVMIEQSRELVAALKAAEKDFRYIELANGDHHLSLQSHRTEFFSAMDAFLAEHLLSSEDAADARAAGGN